MTTERKDNIKQGFVYYVLSTLTLAIIFFSYIFNGQSTEVMDCVGWIYFVSSCYACCIVYACSFSYLASALGCCWLPSMDYKNYSFNSLCLTVYRCCSE